MTSQTGPMAACWDDPSLYLDEAVELLNQKTLYDYSEHAMRSVLADLNLSLKKVSNAVTTMYRE